MGQGEVNRPCRDPLAPRQDENRHDRARAACKARIRAVIDLPAQVNLQGAALAGLLTWEEAELLRQGQEWILDMRQAARAMAADPGRCGDWPDPPAGFARLARGF